MGGHAPDTKKAKAASCPGTRQKPSLDVPFGLFGVPETPGALFDQIQAHILGRFACLLLRAFELEQKITEYLPRVLPNSLVQLDLNITLSQKVSYSLAYTCPLVKESRTIWRKQTP